MRAARPVRVDALEAVAPLDRDQRPERRRRLERRTEASVVAQAAAKSRIVHRRANRRSHRDARACPADQRERAAQDGAAIIADQRRRIAVKPVVERAERVPAEAIEIAARHPRALDRATSRGLITAERASDAP